jgi:hypothetical protein
MGRLLPAGAIVRGAVGAPGLSLSVGPARSVSAGLGVAAVASLDLAAGRG